MANTKISALTSASTPVAGTEVLPIVQSSATVKLAISDLTPGLSTITAAKGGTGQTTYAVGDLLYASASTTLSKLADVATGNALISGGVTTAPSWGKVGLTTHVSGTLPTANGGTNLTSFTANGVVYASSASVLTTGSAINFNGTDLRVGTTSTPNGTTLGAEISGGGVGTFSANSTQSISVYRLGTTGSMVAFFYGATNVGTITTGGTTTSYNTTSDYRLKENIAPMTGALTKIAQLNPVTYNWKSDGSDGQGFIAHELQAVVPDCVTGEKDAVDADGNPQYQGIDTSFLIATLTAAIQEQQALITTLTARIAALETKIPA